MRSNYLEIKLVRAVWRYREKKINYPQALTSAIQLQNRSYHVEERTRAAARAMRANLIVKIKKIYVNL